jgi:hypothetical protein
MEAVGRCETAVNIYVIICCYVEQAVLLVTPYRSVLEVPGSNADWDTGYTDKYLCFFVVPLYSGISPLGHNRFHPNPFEFRSHPNSRRNVVRDTDSVVNGTTFRETVIFKVAAVRSSVITRNTGCPLLLRYNCLQSPW